MAGASPAGTQTLSRATALLKLITSNNRTGLRLVDLYRRAGLERPTAHRLLQGMLAERLVRQDAETKRYHLGPLIYEMGLAATPRIALRDICAPYLQSIAETTGDTVFMTVRSGLDGVCVARADGTFPIKFFVHDVGRHRPLNVGATGIALLAAMPPEEADRICRINAERTLRKNPRFDVTRLLADVQVARRMGYSMNTVMDVPLVQSIGMAIRHPDQTPAASISVSTLGARLRGDRLRTVFRCMSSAVVSIEEELCAKPPLGIGSAVQSERQNKMQT